jgi:hypothetical protein
MGEKECETIEIQDMDDEWHQFLAIISSPGDSWRQLAFRSPLPESLIKYMREDCLNFRMPDGLAYWADFGDPGLLSQTKFVVCIDERHRQRAHDKKPEVKEVAATKPDVRRNVDIQLKYCGVWSTYTANEYWVDDAGLHHLEFGHTLPPDTVKMMNGRCMVMRDPDGKAWHGGFGSPDVGDMAFCMIHATRESEDDQPEVDVKHAKISTDGGFNWFSCKLEGFIGATFAFIVDYPFRYGDIFRLDAGNGEGMLMVVQKYADRAAGSTRIRCIPSHPAEERSFLAGRTNIQIDNVSVAMKSEEDFVLPGRILVCDGWLPFDRQDFDPVNYQKVAAHWGEWMLAARHPCLFDEYMDDVCVQVGDPSKKKLERTWGSSFLVSWQQHWDRWSPSEEEIRRWSHPHLLGQRIDTLHKRTASDRKVALGQPSGPFSQTCSRSA